MSNNTQSVSVLKIGDGAKLDLAYDYRVFFTNKVCSAYLDLLPSEEISGKNSTAKENISAQIRAAAAVYATVIYYIYPNKPLFKKEIDSTPELSANFRKAEQWINTNGFAGLAEEFVGTVESALESSEVV